MAFFNPQENPKQKLVHRRAVANGQLLQKFIREGLDETIDKGDELDWDQTPALMIRTMEIEAEWRNIGEEA